MYIECAIDVQIKHNIDTFPDSLGTAKWNGWIWIHYGDGSTLWI